MIINVTQADLDLGRRGSSMNCPVARALKRAGFNEPHVFPSHVENYREDISLPGSRVNLPAEATKFIIAYDRYEEVFPFQFELGEEI